jgi:hypothetical protein
MCACVPERAYLVWYVGGLFTNTARCRSGFRSDSERQRRRVAVAAAAAADAGRLLVRPRHGGIPNAVRHSRPLLAASSKPHASRRVRLYVGVRLSVRPSVRNATSTSRAHRSTCPADRVGPPDRRSAASDRPRPVSYRAFFVLASAGRTLPWRWRPLRSEPARPGPARPVPAGDCRRAFGGVGVGRFYQSDAACLRSGNERTHRAGRSSSRADAWRRGP